MLQDITSNAIGNIISGLVVALFMLCLKFYTNRQDKEATQKELVLDIKNKTYRSTVVVVAFALAFLQMAWSIVIFTIIPVTKEYLGGGSDSEGMPLSLVLILLAMGIVMVPVAIYVNHRLKRTPVWMNPALVVATFTLMIIEISIITGDPPPLDQFGIVLVLLGITSVALLPGAYLGQYLAKKSQHNFTMNQLFKRLPKHDKKELIELVDSLPSVAGTMKA